MSQAPGEGSPRVRATRHLLELGRLARHTLAAAALALTGVWLSAALALDTFLGQLAAGWLRIAAPPAAAPRPVSAAVRPVNVVASVAAGLARWLRAGAAAHLRAARRADGWLLVAAARSSNASS